ncbi:restriction endonuclease subunit S [Hymenobacter puniceus]|uniref:restriction endonuclease subunit S n=1 Tax=Hymenobacter sp. BT190 TaxID=2763505 RepID=UPI0016511353|nr:restriction endonuclease subunit S [Hymenobacter sp. BT190]MBC6697353.1 restriction endonuclease subunit S [Hymenobacter sp. BT190]
MSKQTEIQWGEVETKVSDLNDWRDYRLDELTEPVKDQYNPDGSSDFNYIGLEHIQQEKLRLNAPGDSSDVTSNKFKFEAGDVLFGKLRPYFRKVARPKFGGICSTDIWVFRAKEDIDQGFLFYFLASWDFVNLANSGEGGTRMPRADWKFLQTTEWKIPPLDEQRAIAAVLSSLDDKIDLLHRQNATLEALAETLFRQWFVEEAKEEWEERKVGDIATHLKVGINPVANHTVLYCQYSLPAYDNGQVPTRELGLEILSNKYEVSPNTILISKLNPRFPRIWAIGESVEPNSVCSTEFQVFKPKKQSLYAYFYFLIKSEDVVGEMTMAASGTSGSHQRIRPEDILNIKVRIPSIEKAEEFSTIAQGFIDKADKNRGVIQTLSTLRDTLLPKLMSGEVRVAY